MVVIEDNLVILPNKAKKITNVQQTILEAINSHGFKEKIIFPSFVKSEFYEAHYDDIKLEYLIDFTNNNDEIYVFNPEYRTLARELSYTQFSDVKNYDYYYIQKIMSYTSSDRKDIIEDIVIGICTVNATDEVDAWEQLCLCAKDVLKALDFNNTTFNDSFKNSIHLFLKGKRVAFGKDESDKGFMSIHFSINDITKALEK